MNTLLKNSLSAQRAERDLLVQRKSASRDILPRLIQALASPLVKVISGPRRAGKSTLAFQCLAHTKFGYVNFEDNTLPVDLDTNELVAAIDEVYDHPQCLFLDEIQVLPRWEQFVNTLHRRERNVIVTGSNSRLLAGELASSLTGRHIAFELLPFSFSEFISQPGSEYVRTPPGYDGDQVHQVFIKNRFERYWQHGGFPEVAIGNEDPRGYLSTLADSIVLKDIVQRYRLRNPRAVSTLIDLLIQDPSARFSANSLRRGLPEPKLSVTTIQNYIRMAQEAYLLYELHPFYAKARTRLKADRKLYVVDHALARSRSTMLSDKRGALLENVVFTELVRRSFVPNERLFYYQTKRGREVDFLVIHSKADPELLQVSYELSAMKTRERELSDLLEAAAETQATRLTIVTFAEKRIIKHEGQNINVVPIFEWLLDRVGS